jgi:multiple sugar transport system substrate-binding protein
MRHRQGTFICVLLLMATLLLALSGCNQNKKTISFVFQTSDEKSANAFWSQVVKDFEADNPDIDVEVKVVPWADGKAAIQKMVDSGRPPTMAKISTREIPAYIAAGLIEPIDSYLTSDFNKDFYPGLIEKGAQYQGRTFGLPIAFTTRAMYYNKDLLKQAGIDNPPATWDELYDAATKVGKLPGGKSGFGLQGNFEGNNAETGIYFYYFVWGNGGDYLTKDGIRAAFNNQEGIEALNFLQKLIKDGGTQPDPTKDARKNLEDAFVNGQYAMVITYNGLAGRMAKEAPNIHYGIAPIPSKTTNVSLAVTDSLVLFSQAANKDAGWRFVQFLYQDKYRLQSFQWEGTLPEKSSLTERPEVKDNPTIRLFLDMEPVARYMPLNTKTSDVAAIMAQELSTAYKGQKDAKTALDDAAARVNELLSYSATAW